MKKGMLSIAVFIKLNSALVKTHVGFRCQRQSGTSLLLISGHNQD